MPNLFTSKKVLGRLFLVLLPLLMYINPVLAAPPAPQPCFNPVPTDNLTDNYITDSNGDPPGPEGQTPEALKFTFTYTGAVGSRPDLTKTMTFSADFSKLQAIFAAPTSDYLEGAYQDANHAQADLLAMKNVDLIKHQGVEGKTAPTAITNDLRQKYVKYVNEKPELAESDTKFSDFNGANAKNINDLVTAYGMPTPPGPSDNRTNWLNGWGKYWENIPTVYNEFYIGKLEFRPVHGLAAIKALKSGDPGSCFPNPTLRTVEFPVPNFFRSAATSGVLNQALIPIAAQSQNNNLLGIQGAVNGIKTTASDFIINCFKFASHNPVTNAIKKAFGVSMEILKAPPVYAAGCSASSVSVVAGGTKTVTQTGYAAGESIRLFGSGSQVELAKTVNSTGSSANQTLTIPANTPAGSYFIVIVTRFPITSTTCSGGAFNVTAANPPTPPPAPTCTINPTTIVDGGQITVSSQNGLSGEIRMAGAFQATSTLLGNLSANASTTVTIPVGTTAGLYAIRVGLFAVHCGDLSVTTAPTPSCTINPTTIVAGGQITVSSQNGLSGEIRILAAFAPPGTQSTLIGNLPANGSATVTIPANSAPGLYAVRVGGFAVHCGDLSVTAAGPACTFSPANVFIGDVLTITSNGAFGLVQIQGAFDLKIYNLQVNLPANGTVQAFIPPVDTSGIYAVRVGVFGDTCKTAAGGDLNINAVAPCSFAPQNVYIGDKITIKSPPGGAFGLVQIQGAFDLKIYSLGVTLPQGGSVVATIPAVDTGGTYAVRAGNNLLAGTCKSDPEKGDLQIQSSLACSFTPGTRLVGETLTINSPTGGAFGLVQIQSQIDFKIYNLGVNLPQGGSITAPIPNVDTSGLYWVRVGILGATCKFNGIDDLIVNKTLTWTVFPLSDKSCIKVSQAGKAGSAPFCAIYPTKFEPAVKGQTNVNPGECGNSTSVFKLNSETNVVCNFQFTWNSHNYDNTDKDLVVPPVGSNGNWDSCKDAGNNQQTCTLTVGVWPDFRIPYLGQIWNNSLYSDTAEVQPNQVTGRPGVYSLFTPSALFPDQTIKVNFTDADVSLAIQNCITTALPGQTPDPNNPYCKKLLDYISQLQAANNLNQLPGFNCDNLAQILTLSPQDPKQPGEILRLRDCASAAFIAVSKKLPGEVNNVLGVNSSQGQVLAASDGNQKERFIGAVDCGKHFSRDVALKPIALQKELGITTQCDVTASAAAPPNPPGNNPSPPPGGNPPGQPKIGGDCGGIYNSANSPQGNFGDPDCDFSIDRLANYLGQFDPADASTWLAIITLESSFQPNSVNPQAVNGTAYGLLQMSDGVNGNGQYDNGYTTWTQQVSNAINYNQNLQKLGLKWCYWQAAYIIGIVNPTSCH